MRDSLDRYFELMQEHPRLFLPRARRKLILDRDVLEQWIRLNDARIGVLAETDFFLFVQDLVTLDDGLMHPYSRLIARKSLHGQNAVVALPVNFSSGGETVLLVSQERHAVGRQMLELPRGFAEPGVDEATQVEREVAAETGARGRPVFLGSAYTDTGMTDCKVSFYLFIITERGRPSPDQTEHIENVMELPMEEVRRRLADGGVSDGYTIQAIALYDRAMRYESVRMQEAIGGS